MGTDVLPLSVDAPGAKVTCGSRALVTADKRNDPPQNSRTLSQAWVRGPVVHRLALHPCSERRQERWISRTARASSVPGVGKERALGYGPEPGGPEGPRQDKALHNDQECLLSTRSWPSHGSLLVVVDQLATIGALAARRRLRSWASP